MEEGRNGIESILTVQWGYHQNQGKVEVNSRIDVPGGTRRCKSTDHRGWTGKTTRKDDWDRREIVEVTGCLQRNGQPPKKGKSRCSRCVWCVLVYRVYAVE